MPEVPAHFNFATDVVDRWAVSRPGALALWWVHAATGAEQELTFREVSAASHRAANFLVACGIRPGDRVLIMLPRIPQWWTAMLGLIRIGAIPVPATLLLTARDVAFRVLTAGVSAAITSPEGIAKLGEFEGVKVLTKAPDEASAAVPAGWHDFDAGSRKAADSFSSPPLRSDDPGILYFTSATTGDPKMVLHSQASYGLGHRITGRLWLDLKPDDIHWNISDLGWGKAAWSSFYGPWQMGACVFALDTTGKFDPGLTLNTLASFPITTWCAPPTALRLIVRQDLSAYQFKHLRHCVTAGEPLNPEVLNLWLTATGLTLHEAYGQTETVVLAGNFRSLGFPIRPGSMGRATPGLGVSVVDDQSRELPPGEEGEIAVRVEPRRPVGMFREYWQNQEEMRRKFRGGWYLTGDRARRDAEGYFWFVGRKDDVIKSSGYRIGPFEVESALIEHPAVMDVGVVGKPDPLRGQIVKAYIVLRPGFSGDSVLAAELQQHCKALVAAYKYPREIEFVSELPKTISGKTRHVELRRAATTAS